MNLRDIIYGFAIGDALGVPFEFKESSYCQKCYNDKYVSGTHNQLPGTWSDDTSILLCMLDSDGDIDRYKQNLIDWNIHSSKFNCISRFDIGNGTSRAISSNFIDNKNSKGNACLAVTLGCFLLGLSREDTLKFVRLTHDNPESFKASLIYFDALDGLSDTNYYGLLLNNGYCSDSAKIAIKCSREKNYKSCIRKAIYYGYDTDSNAAFTGALAAMKYIIPKYYIDNLQGKDKIDTIINNIAWKRETVS